MDRNCLISNGFIWEYILKLKYIFLHLILFSLMIINGNMLGQTKGYGLGIMVGEPTGFSAKYWLNKENAVDFGFAYSFVHPNSSLSLHSDYLIHIPTLITKDGELPFYYGFGGRLHVSAKDKPFLGARAVAGILWMSKEYPIDAFFEIAPVFNIFAETSLHLDMAIGVRYYLE
jgi:hypothetical protein